MLGIASCAKPQDEATSASVRDRHSSTLERQNLRQHHTDSSCLHAASPVKPVPGRIEWLLLRQSGRIPTFIPTTRNNSPVETDTPRESSLRSGREVTQRTSDVTYSIFEGTAEIQRLVVARSISGLHIP
jgi:hypothetical protein